MYPHLLKLPLHFLFMLSHAQEKYDNVILYRLSICRFPFPDIKINSEDIRANARMLYFLYKQWRKVHGQIFYDTQQKSVHIIPTNGMLFCSLSSAQNINFSQMYLSLKQQCK